MFGEAGCNLKCVNWVEQSQPIDDLRSQLVLREADLGIFFLESRAVQALSANCFNESLRVRSARKLMKILHFPPSEPLGGASGLSLGNGMASRKSVTPGGFRDDGPTACRETAVAR